MGAKNKISGFLLMSFMLFASSVFASGKLRVDNRHFIDEDGGVVVLRGLNVAGDFKTPPFVTITEPELLDPLKDWGVSVVRLLFSWEAFEEERGDYNLDYLSSYKNVVDWAWERGIFVIIDFHQDAFSRYQVGGCGDGFPEWAIPYWITRDVPDNSESCKRWSTKMITDWDMHRSWHYFYKDHNGVKTSYENMMGYVSKYFKDHEGVIGYDLINEPWGNEKTEIAPFFEDLAKIVSFNDPEAIIFVSPHALSSSGIKSNLPQLSFDNFVYSPHYYDGSVLLSHFWFGISPEGALEKKKRKAEELNAPLFIGEFGCDADTVFGTEYMDAFYKVMDKWFISGAQWNYTPGWNSSTLDGWNGEDLSVIDDRGNIRKNYRIRPYPKRISGEPLNFEVERKKRTGAISVRLEWEHEPLKGETKLFVPREILFGNHEYVVELSGDSLGYRYDAEETHILLVSPVPGKKTIVIRSKNF